MPLWSSVMIGDWLKTNEIKLFRHRLTNNPVENRFKQIKYHLLHGMTKVSCSELLTATYRQIEALYEQFYRGKDASFIKAQAVEQNKGFCPFFEITCRFKIFRNTLLIIL